MTGRSGRLGRAQPARLLVALAAVVTIVSSAPIAAASGDPDDGAMHRRPAAEAAASRLAASGLAASGSGRWIVVLHDAERIARVSVARTATELATKLRFEASHVYDRVVSGFAATLDEQQIAALRADPRIRYVHRDRPLELTAQLESAAIRRVNAHLAPATKIDQVDLPADRVNADIAILDTGVDAGHPDLNVVGGADCTDHAGANGSPVGHPAYGDITGHGTHVAGIAAAIDNGSGVVGVAPGARIWSVRIFGADIAGWESNLLCGIEWVTDQRDGDRPRMEVANMSMRIGKDDDGDPVGDDGQCGQSVDRPDPVHAAICASVAAGNVYAVAAGNERNDASRYIPASYDEVITVSALADYDGAPGGLAPAPASCAPTTNGVPDVDDTFADFSTHGADVDLIAPGVCVTSTYRGGGYRSMSGTSMATPAVAGGVALYRLAHPEADPAWVRAGLIGAGTDEWATQTDPDGVPERLLDVGTAGAPADFQLMAPSTLALPAGGSRSYDMEVRRSFGFADAISLALDTSGLPAGVTAELSSIELPEVGDSGALLTVTVTEGTMDGSSSMTIIASGGPEPVVHSATAELIVDSVAPAVSVPVVRFSEGSAPGPETVPLQIAWSGSDASGTHRYEIGRFTDSGPWATIGVVGPMATAATSFVPPDHTYQFRVRAIDLAANRTTARTAVVKLRRRAETAPSIVYSAGWTRQTAFGAIGGSVRHASTAGAEATITFTGRAFAWVSPLSSARGSAEVYLDGVLVETVDLRSAARLAARVVFATEWPDSAPRTVRIRVLGTDGHPRVDIDEVLTLR